MALPGRSFGLARTTSPAINWSGVRVSKDGFDQQAPLPAAFSQADRRLQTLAKNGVIQSPEQPGLLHRGGEGVKVRRLQRQLRQEGFKIRRDGLFGPQTERAVRRFQKRNHLEVDGIVGPETRRALREAAHKANQALPAAKPSLAKPEPTPSQPVAAQKPAPANPKPSTPPPQRALAKPEPHLPKPAVSKPEPAPTPPANHLGLKPTTLQRLQNQGLLKTLQSIPPDLAGRYGELSPKLKKALYEQLSGSTWGVSHKDAFVRGSAMGQDTFQMMGDKLKDAANEGSLKASEVRKILTDLPRLRQLSSQQRQAMVEAILLQRGS